MHPAVLVAPAPGRFIALSYQIYGVCDFSEIPFVVLCFRVTSNHNTACDGQAVLQHCKLSH